MRSVLGLSGTYDRFLHRSALAHFVEKLEIWNTNNLQELWGHFLENLEYLAIYFDRLDRIRLKAAVLISLLKARVAMPSQL